MRLGRFLILRQKPSLHCAIVVELHLWQVGTPPPSPARYASAQFGTSWRIRALWPAFWKPAKAGQVVCSFCSWGQSDWVRMFLLPRTWEGKLCSWPISWAWIRYSSLDYQLAATLYPSRKGTEVRALWQAARSSHHIMYWGKELACQCANVRQSCAVLLSNRC